MSVQPNRPNEKQTGNHGSDRQPIAPPNPWAIRIATVGGIPIRLHFTFLLFLIWIGSAGPRGLNILYVLTIFACVVLHELGHSLVARHYGIPVADITLYPIGGVARIEKRPAARQELWIALAGPAVNIVIAAILAGVLATQGGMIPETSLVHALGTPRGFLEYVFIANVWLALFNLVPAFPMDGGRVLRAILALNMPQERATAIAASVGQFIAIAVGIWAIFGQQWILMFIAFFVYLGAGQEAFVYRQEALIEGAQVKQAMITDVHTLTVGNTLKEAADVLLATSQHDFPVLHGDTVQGLLTRNGLLRGLAENGPGAYVAGVMQREFVTAGPEDDLAQMLPRLQESGPVIVLEPNGEHRLLGIVTGENVQEFFAVRQIVAARNGNINGNIRS